MLIATIGLIEGIPISRAATRILPGGCAGAVSRARNRALPSLRMMHSGGKASTYNQSFDRMSSGGSNGPHRDEKG